MKIVTIQNTNRKHIRAFIDLPGRIYRNIPQWVPPLSGEIEQLFNRKKNPFYSHSDAVFLLALGDGDQPMGRLCVLDNRRYNEFNNERTAFFTLFECVDDTEAAKLLFTAGIKWAQERGLNKIHGPKGFTALDGLGLLVEGFEHRPAFGIPYNPKYYPRLIESVGLEKSSDIVSGHMYSTTQFPEKMHEFSRIVQKRTGLKVNRYRSRRELLKLVPRLRDLYNGALAGTTGNVPLTEDEAKRMANQILWFAEPKLIKILTKDDEPVGFLFAYPDISEAVQRQHGRLFPFGWIDLLREMKKTKWLNINGAGIIEKYRGAGGTAILFSEMFKSVLEGQFEHADLVQVGSDNDRMQNELANFGIDFYKKHRLYEMSI